MNSRDQHLLKSRPTLPCTKVSGNMTSGEQFQNKTLRPIVELQRDLFLAVFRNYIAKHKNVFYQYSVEKRMDYITNAVQKDIKFRNSLKGMVIGQFTIREYETYITNSSALNKRMMALVRECLLESIQLLEYAEVG